MRVSMVHMCLSFVFDLFFLFLLGFFFAKIYVKVSLVVFAG